MTWGLLANLALVISAPPLQSSQTAGLTVAPILEKDPVRQFAEITETGAYIDLLTAPTWADAQKRLLDSNPGRETAVESVLRDSRQHYREAILGAIPMIVPGIAQKLGSTETVAIIARIATPYAATTAGKDLARRIDSERVYCFVTRAPTAMCASLGPELEALRTSRGETRRYYITMLMAVRFASAAAIQLSMDSGSPLALLDKDRVLAAGLTWPE